MDNRQPTQQAYVVSSVIMQRSDGKIAFLLRKNTSWMQGYYGITSGRTEKNETALDGAVREAYEEVGVKLAAEDLSHAITCHRKSTQSSGDVTEWVDIYFLATSWQGDAKNMEPDVHSELAWFSLNSLPENCIPAHRWTLQKWAKGERYTEFGYDQPQP